MKELNSIVFENFKKFKKRRAIFHNNKHVTYEELSNIISKISGNIANFKIKKPKVAILLGQSVNAYACIFATLRIGGYYTPLNIDSPDEKNLKIIETFKPDILIVENDKFDRKLLNQKKTKILNLTKLKENYFNKFLKNNKISYVIFTSGSTGEPKGVIIPHEGLINYLKWIDRDIRVKKNDRWSQHSNLSFDLSVLDVYGCLIYGACLYPITSKIDKLFPANAIKKYSLTIWNSVPSVIDLMIKSNQLKDEYLKSLRLFTFCGEPLMEHHLDNIFNLKKKIKLHNTYGPTEATVSVTNEKFTKSNYKSKVLLNACLGKPINNMSISFQNLDLNNAGEILISGPQVALGYWKDVKKTKKYFGKIKINKTNIRYFKTGDIAKKINNKLYFYQRIDRQIKKFGHRIELGEIDFALKKIGAKISFTLFYKNKIYSFIEGKINKSKNKIENDLSLILSKSHIPDKIILLKKIPRNMNGKIDEKKIILKHLITNE